MFFYNKNYYLFNSFFNLRQRLQRVRPIFSASDFDIETISPLQLSKPSQYKYKWYLLAYFPRQTYTFWEDISSLLELIF